jgi:inner membrane protein involved in colicin E2 resistance
MKMVENSYPPPPPPPMKQTHVTSSSNVVHNQPTLTRSVSTIPYTHQQTLTRQVSTIPYTHQQTVQRTNTTTNGFATKSNKKNITIEMPEHLVADRTMSPRTRERSLNKIVQNVGHVVEDARKRYNGDVPNKVIVTVDQHAKQTD